jgi:hypothetical protein
MTRPDTIIIDGRAYSWRLLIEQRRAQLESWRKAQGTQPALFPLIEDCRPKAERTAAGRYEQPTLLTLLGGRSGAS